MNTNFSNKVSPSNSPWRLQKKVLTFKDGPGRPCRPGYVYAGKQPLVKYQRNSFANQMPWTVWTLWTKPFESTP